MVVEEIGKKRGAKLEIMIFGFLWRIGEERVHESECDSVVTSERMFKEEEKTR